MARLDFAVEGDRVRMTCTCGAAINRSTDTTEPARPGFSCASPRWCASRRSARLPASRPPRRGAHAADRGRGRSHHRCPYRTARRRAQQQRAMPHVGVLVGESAPHPFTEAFRSGMRELGYVEGRTIAIEWRYADALYTRAVELGKHRRRGVPRAARSRG